MKGIYANQTHSLVDAHKHIFKRVKLIFLQLCHQYLTWFTTPKLKPGFMGSGIAHNQNEKLLQ